MIYLLIGLHITFFVVAGFLAGLLYAMAILIKAQKKMTTFWSRVTITILSIIVIFQSFMMIIASKHC